MGSSPLRLFGDLILLNSITSSAFTVCSYMCHLTGLSQLPGQVYQLWIRICPLSLWPSFPGTPTVNGMSELPGGGAILK